MGQQTLLCRFWPGIRSRKCPRSQEASFHKSSLILANSGGLEMTAGSYMTLITWKREGGKKSASSVFEGFLIADKRPKFCRTNAAHICPRCCLAVRDAKPGGSACGTRLHRCCMRVSPAPFKVMVFSHVGYRRLALPSAQKGVFSL